MQPFVYLATCGCVFSQGGLKAVSRSAPSKTPPTEVPVDAGKEAGSEQAKDLDLCPQCGAKYDRASDVRMLNPPVEVEEQMRAAMEARRAAEPVKTKGKGKKRKAAADAAAEPAVKKQALPSTNPSIAAASRGVAASLAEEEARRKAGMSDAVKSLYSSNDGPKRKETFMTMGTFTRVSRNHRRQFEEMLTVSLVSMRDELVLARWRIGPLSWMLWLYVSLYCYHV